MVPQNLLYLFLKSSSQLEVNVLIHIDFMDLGNLREFIQNFKPQNVLASLSLFIHQPIIFFYETLMGRKEDECFCSSCHTKCWWHGLKDVQVSGTAKTDENIDFKTMLDALPTFSSQENISLG
ncbi:hypothetical protein E2542_SST14290 [Spatholobus suberectus]|nr:hypothetical protein E2542_SST14290 [Spatholobus suberectus]